VQVEASRGLLIIGMKESDGSGHDTQKQKENKRCKNILNILNIVHDEETKSYIPNI